MRRHRTEVGLSEVPGGGRGRRPCTLPCTEYARPQSRRNREADKGHDCEEDLRGAPRGQEDAVGRRVLERIRVHGRKVHRRGCDIGVCAKPREGEGLQATLAELVDVDTESLGGIPCRLCPREINYILRSFV